MIRARNRWLYLTLGLAFGHLLIGTNPLNAQGDCKVVLEAANKTMATATHTYSTVNLAGKEQIIEMIYLPGVIYSRVNGKWSSVKMTAEELADLRKPKARSDTATCKYVKDEALNGETAAVYSVHDVTSQGTVESQIWISKAKGLPLRQDMDISAGSSAGKSHSSSRYEYGDVKAP